MTNRGRPEIGPEVKFRVPEEVRDAVDALADSNGTNRAEQLRRIVIDGVPLRETSAPCPYCGETFYAPGNQDPLKHHIDYCEKAPGADDARFEDFTNIAVHPVTHEHGTLQPLRVFAWCVTCKSPTGGGLGLDGEFAGLEQILRAARLHLATTPHLQGGAYSEGGRVHPYAAGRADGDAGYIDQEMIGHPWYRLGFADGAAER
jgi:hypothetical protein